MNKKKRFCIIIVNYKTPLLTIDCIRTLNEQLDPNRDHIVVVDNKSGGNDIAIINKKIKSDGFSDLVTLIEAPSNDGFSSGNNIGIQAVRADFYMLSNADTLFRPGSIQSLHEAIIEHPEAGIISPRLEWLNGEPQISCFRFYTPYSEIIYSAGTGIITSLLKKYNVHMPVANKITKPQWVSFACVIIRSEVFDKIGLLDEGYFMYYEDVDFCRRALKAGFEVLNWPYAHVVHLRGQSSGIKKLQKEKKRLPQYHYKSRSRYYRKFYGPIGPIVSNLCWVAGRTVSWLREKLMGKKQTVFDNQFFDIWLR